MKYAVRIMEREQMNAVLWAHILTGGNIREAALLLGISDNRDSSRVRLHHFIKKHALQDTINQRSQEIVYDCLRGADSDPQKAADLLAQRLSELFPYLPEPSIDAAKFCQIARKLKVAL